MLYGIILVIHILVSFVLIAVILLLAGRGGGLSDSFGGGAASSILGTRGTTYLTRATTVCATVFMLTSLGLAVLSVNQGKSLMTTQAAVRPAAKPWPISPVKPAEPAPQPQTPEPKQEPAGGQQ